MAVQPQHTVQMCLYAYWIKQAYRRTDQWVQLPAWAFLLVFYSNHSYFWATAWDKQTNCSIS